MRTPGNQGHAGVRPHMYEIGAQGPLVVNRTNYSARTLHTVSVCLLGSHELVWATQDQIAILSGVGLPAPSFKLKEEHGVVVIRA